MSVAPDPGEHGRRRVPAAVLFGLAVLGGAAAGLLFGLLAGADRGAPAIPVTRPATATAWPAVYRCGLVVQPEDLDRCACGC